MTQLLRSPWTSRFEELVSCANRSLILCAPYIGRGPCARVISRIHSGVHESFQLTVLTDLSRDNILSGATDVGALADVVQAYPGTAVRFLPSLHAKVYVADELQAIITSGNLTDSGLLRNFEYGVVFSDNETVRAIRDDVLQYASLGSPISHEQLLLFSRIAEELREMRKTAETSIRRNIRNEFERRLCEADAEILQVRAAGRTAHAIFADAIMHLLRKGPLTTQEMHQAIKHIHPDLCDDTIDRVIDGRHFGKKWKHGVRTAQVFLRRRGDIYLDEGVWRLAH